MAISVIRAANGRLISRRHWVLGSGAGILAAFSVGSWLVHDKAADPDESEPPLEFVAPQMIAFIGALFGRDLTQEDRQELAQRLADAVAESVSLARGCGQLARTLGQIARSVGADTFLAASAVQSQLVVDRLMLEGRPTLKQRVWSKLSGTHREFLHAQSQTIAQLAWLYRHSGAPWRARGYSRCPGVPGNWREVLQAGGAYR